MLHGIEMPTVLVPLRGRVKLTESDGALVLQKGQLFVGEGASRMQAVGSGDALWVALTAPATAPRLRRRRATPSRRGIARVSCASRSPRARMDLSRARARGPLLSSRKLPLRPEALRR
jgi:hypothetical protein